jgi:hypothetical protein
MRNTNTKKEEAPTIIKRGEYQIPPKEGFILTHFLTASYEREDSWNMLPRSKREDGL